MSYPPPWQAQPGHPNYNPNANNWQQGQDQYPNSVPYPQVVIPSPYVQHPQYYYQQQPAQPMRMQNGPPPHFAHGALSPPQHYIQSYPPQTYPPQIANEPAPARPPFQMSRRPSQPSQTLRDQPQGQVSLHSQPARTPSQPSQSVQPKSQVPVQPSQTLRIQSHVQTDSNDVEEPPKPPPDHKCILLGLAEDYLNAAHSQGSNVAVSKRKDDKEQYYKLVATALGCLESVLKNWRLEPRSEALVRLKYASILYEETENTLEAETALSNGISVCERNRLHDLKYSSQDLLARILHQSNSKAAIKVVDGMIEEVVAYKRTAWEYHFRFLRMSMTLQISTHQDSISTLSAVKRIASTASEHGHRVISALCAVLEALTHLHSASTDCIDQAQTALASARRFQLDKHVQDVPQIKILIHFIDLSCSLQSLDIAESTKRANDVRAILEDVLKDSRWRDDGSFTVPISNSPHHPSAQATREPSLKWEQGNTLTFNWLSRQEIYAFGYLLNGITMSPRNAQDGRKAESYLQEGLRITKESMNTPKSLDESLSSAVGRLESNRILHCHFLIQLTFLLCSRADWRSASSTLVELSKNASQLGTELPVTVRCLMQYLQGVIYQGSGELNKALSAFQSRDLALPSASSQTARIDTCRDTAILASLNCVLILHDSRHPLHHNVEPLIESVKPFCTSSSSKYIQAAYNLVKAAIHRDDEGHMKRKAYLEVAFRASTAITNNHITCIALSFMSWKMFSGAVGAQAEKSSMASRAMAQKAGSKLWTSVAEDLLANTLEREGKRPQAEKMKEQALRNAEALPEAFQRYKMVSVEIP